MKAFPESWEQLQALVESSSEQLQRAFLPCGSLHEAGAALLGLPAPVSSGQHGAGDCPHLLGEGLSPRKHLVVKPRQRCWHEALHFLKCRLFFKPLPRGCPCAVEKGKERPSSHSDDCSQNKDIWKSRLSGAQITRHNILGAAVFTGALPNLPQDEQI